MNIMKRLYSSDEQTQALCEKLQKLEDIFELMEKMETTTVCWQDNEGNIYKEYYGDDSILYNLKENSIEIYGYGFLDGYRIEEYGNFWWFEGDK